MAMTSPPRQKVGNTSNRDAQLSKDFVSVDWLSQHLGDVVVLACPFSPASPEDKEVNPELAAQNMFTRIGHIPGARLIDIDVVGLPTSDNIQEVLKHFSDALGQNGVSRDARIVIDDMEGGAFTAPYIWWLSKLCGHENVHILDGGFMKWRMKGHDVDVTEPKPVEEQSYGARINLDQFASFDDVRLLSTGDQLISVRHAHEFESTKGDIPGSVNIPYSQLANMDTPYGEGVIQSAAALKAAFDNAELDVSKPVTAYCSVGIVTPLFMLAARAIADENMACIRAYAGSWKEWNEKSPDRSIVAP